MLIEMMDEPTGALGYSATMESTSTLAAVGEFCRRRFGAEIPDPQDIAAAARYVVQADRSRSAAIQVASAEATLAGAGPFGGARSGHILYLRSFIASPRLPRYDVAPWGQVDLEEILAGRLNRAPLLALGDAELLRFGPGRAVTTDESWREVLRQLAIEAQILLVVPCATQGTSWEMEWVAANKFLHKTCFVMPPPGPGEEAWWRANWTELKHWSVRLGVKLPEYTPEGCVFRADSYGGIDEIPFSTIYAPPFAGLRSTLLGLLFRPNVSWDFAYGLQEGIAANQTHEPARDGHVSGDDGDEDLAIIRQLEGEKRLEFSNWHYDAPRVPNAPGVIVLYGGPFRLLWAQETSDLHDTLARYADGQLSDFTREFFHARVMKILGPDEVEQLLEKSLSIETVVASGSDSSSHTDSASCRTRKRGAASSAASGRARRPTGDRSCHGASSAQPETCKGSVRGHTRSPAWPRRAPQLGVESTP